MQSTTHHVVPEDQDSVRQRDLPQEKRRDIGSPSSNGSRHHGAAGDSPAPRRRHKNPADRPGSTASRRRSARQDAYVAGHAGPPEAFEVLANAKRYGHCFTDNQWLILFHAYGPDKRTDYWMSKHTNLGDKGSIRKARLVVEERCFELIREHKPTLAKVERIHGGNPRNEKLTSDERAILNKYRKDRPKKGRKIISGWGPAPQIPAEEDVGSTTLHAARHQPKPL
jgi:hypothetical protein